MNIEVKNNAVIVREAGMLITDGQSALDLIATVYYETGCTAMVLPKAALSEDFFRLSTGLAGEVLQKFTNYHMRLAVIGDFSGYTSENLKDFLYESNKGGAVLFLADEEDAVARLSGK
ncbi:MAG TPA: DUF4180 domain-containing protein [Pseudoflavonifractor sp.]|nr:DUF4180 domain-containing protein [Pseudoflavonifractor sp.]